MEHEERGEEPFWEIYERWGRSMMKFFPDFTLQLWAAFHKYKGNTTDFISYYYSDGLAVDQVLILFTFKSLTENIVNILQLISKETVRNSL